MARLDNAFVASIEAGLSAALIPVELDRSAPFLDVEVVRSPYIDTDAAGEPDPRAHTEELQRAFDTRTSSLRDLFTGDCQLLVSYGDPLHAPSATGSSAIIESATWSAALNKTAQRFAMGRWLSVAEGSCRSSDESGEAHPGTACDAGMLFRLHDGVEDLALAAVVGLDPAIPDAHRRTKDCAVSRLMSFLGTRAGLVTPIYLVCVTPRDVILGDAATRPFARFLRSMRPSLVLHGGVATSELARVAIDDLREGHRREQPLSLASCPTFKAGEGAPGMGRLRLDVEDHAINVAFRHDLGPDRPVTAVQAQEPLRSVSRVSGGEHELHRLAQRLLEKSGERYATDAALTREIAEFERNMEATWDTDGYVTLCDKSGRFPPIEPERSSPYNLLVLLRRQPDGEGYDVLLSNHTPLASPAIARWDTLLLPAFTKIKALLERLRDDVVRQATQAEDLERAERARLFVRTVARSLRGDSDWSVKTRRLASFTTRKLSPTDGRVTEYEYAFVTIPSLLHQPAVQTTERSSDGARIIQWLSGLPSVRPDGAGGAPLEALEQGGAGVRWDPESCLAEPDGWRQRRRMQTFPRGVVWFPFGEKLWRRCPSIVARNADVMIRLERELNDKRVSGRLPVELLLAAGS